MLLPTQYFSLLKIFKYSKDLLEIVIALPGDIMAFNSQLYRF
jgi:hypothetical protein